MTMDLDAALAEQRRAFAAELPVSAGVRDDRLRRLIALVRDNADAIAAAVSADFGHRSKEQTLLSDVIPTIGQCKHALANLARWMKPERRKLPFPLGLLGARGWIEYQPKGIVGVIAPWNFPVMLALGPVAGAFAAGNRCMVKVSEMTPRTSELLADVAARHFDAGELRVIVGGPEIGERFARLPFDHLFFTGGGAIGRRILQAAAENLTPVTLELGGKSPAVIGHDANLRQAADRIVIGKTLNAGQVCLAPDYILVPRRSEDELVRELRDAAAAMYPDMRDNPDYGSLVNARHRQRIADYLAEARQKGADIVEVDTSAETLPGADTNKLPFHIVRGVRDDMKLMREEIFGPVLPILAYDDFDEAIAFINGRDRPLGLYYFGSDRREQRALVERTLSGGVTLGDVIFHGAIDDLPFGGIGASGMGAYHGIDGFRTFSHAKAVYRQTRVDIAALGGIRPPYGKATAATIARGLRS